MNARQILTVTRQSCMQPAVLTTPLRSACHVPGPGLSMEERKGRRHTSCPQEDQNPRALGTPWQEIVWKPEKSFWKVLKRMVKINTWQCFLSRDQDPKSQVGCNHRQLSDSLPTMELIAMQAALGLQGQWAFCPPFLPVPGPPMRIPSCMRFIWREDTTPLEEGEGAPSPLSLSRLCRRGEALLKR